MIVTQIFVPRSPATTWMQLFDDVLAALVFHRGIKLL